VKRTALALILILTLLISSMLVVRPAKSSPRTIVVPDDFSSIQRAINVASAGDTVFVKAGRYTEEPTNSITLNKPLSLVGEDQAKTIITSARHLPYGVAIKVNAANATVSGFTIRDFDCAINVLQPNCTVANNTLVDGSRGIEVDYSPLFTLENNDISGYDTWGILLLGSYVNNGTIKGNTLDGNGQPNVGYGAILAYGSDDTTIANNTLFNNIVGLSIAFSARMNVFGNDITRNDRGIVFGTDSENIVICQNSISYNQIGIFAGTYHRDGQAIAPSSLVYENFFTDNNQQAAVNQNETQCAFWDDGRIGNYWSDYQARYPNASEIGNYGIGDTAYTINANNTDNHPLTEPAVPTVIPEFTGGASETESFPTLFAFAVTVTVAALFGGSLLVYFKKRKQQSE
jgi:parallel beta-helix repeat protein